MAKFSVTRSILIDAPIDKVFNIVNDFHHWKAWSPWLIQEPEATVSVADDGKYYEWNGDRTGSGNMTVLNEQENTSVNYDLNFLKPWKSNAKVSFYLKPTDTGTNVTWTLDSSLPFFMFWMKKMMAAFVGSDYERGLAMLKDYAEHDEVHSKLNFKGISEFPGLQYIGIKTNCTKETIGTQMAADLEKLGAYFKDKSDRIAGSPFSIYHKWDLVKNRITYTSGIPVKSVPDNLPTEFTIGTIPSSKIYTLQHEGPYGHLGNAWSTMMGMSRSKTFKQNKRMDPFETYVNMPGEVADKELITEVHFPVK